MPIPNRFPITTQVATTQEERIGRCRSAACFAELALNFGTSSATDLEKVIDGASGNDADGFATYRQIPQLIKSSKKLAITSMRRLDHSNCSRHAASHVLEACCKLPALQARNLVGTQSAIRLVTGQTATTSPRVRTRSLCMRPTPSKC